MLFFSFFFFSDTRSFTNKLCIGTAAFIRGRRFPWGRSSSALGLPGHNDIKKKNQFRSYVVILSTKLCCSRFGFAFALPFRCVTRPTYYRAIKNHGSHCQAWLTELTDGFETEVSCFPRCYWLNSGLNCWTNKFFLHFSAFPTFWPADMGLLRSAKCVGSEFSALFSHWAAKVIKTCSSSKEQNRASWKSALKCPFQLRFGCWA